MVGCVRQRAAGARARRQQGRLLRQAACMLGGAWRRGVHVVLLGGAPLSARLLQAARARAWLREGP